MMAMRSCWFCTSAVHFISAEVTRLYGGQFEVHGPLRQQDRWQAEARWKAKGATRFSEVVYLLVKK